MNQMTEAQQLTANRPIYTLVVAWILLFPLLVFAAGYGFSFERGEFNTTIGATLAAQGLSETGLATNPLLRTQTLAVYLICTFLMAPFVRVILANFRRDLLISSLTLLAFCSCAWSQNAFKTFGYAVILTAGIAFAFYLLERFPPNDLMKLILMVGIAAALGSLFLVMFYPQYGLQSRERPSGAWEGIFAQKNNCGEIMLYLLLPAFFVRLKSRSTKVLRIIYIATVLLIIAMCQSRGVWVSCGSCLLFVAMLRLLKRMPRKDVAATAFVLSGLAAIAAMVVYNYFNLLMLAIGKDPTMTGRTLIWSGLMPSLLKRPMLGYGFMAFWQGLRGESAYLGLLMNWPGMSYAENGVIELWLELGAVGVCLYALVFCRAVKDAVFCFSRTPSPAAMSYIALLFALAVSNIEGGVLLSPTDLKFLLPMIAFLGLRREAKRVRSERSRDITEGLLARTLPISLASNAL